MCLLVQTVGPQCGTRFPLSSVTPLGWAVPSTPGNSCLSCYSGGDSVIRPKSPWREEGRGQEEGSRDGLPVRIGEKLAPELIPEEQSREVQSSCPLPQALGCFLSSYRNGEKKKKRKKNRSWVWWALSLTPWGWQRQEDQLMVSLATYQVHGQLGLHETLS